jgi:hypothetical protein
MFFLPAASSNSLSSVENREEKHCFYMTNYVQDEKRDVHEKGL